MALFQITATVLILLTCHHSSVCAKREGYKPVVDPSGIDEFLQLLEAKNKSLVCLEKRNCLEELGNVFYWLKNTSKVNEIVLEELVSAEYESSINITDYNQEKWEIASTAYQEWSGDASRQANELLSDYDDCLSACGVQMKRMLESYWLDGCLIPRKSSDKVLLSSLLSDLETTFSTTTVTQDDKLLRLDPELTKIMAQSRDYEILLKAWRGWHDAVGVRVKENFTDTVKLFNDAAKSQGFPSAAEVWKYQDVEDVEAEKTMETIMEEMNPMYLQLHTYVRAKLINEYKPQLKGGPNENILDPNGPIPVHLLGNMYGQTWNNLEDLVLPYPDAPPLPNVTDVLVKRNFTAKQMFLLAEDFFLSLGFKPMTEKFWNKSVIERPSSPDIQMVCHASASDMVAKDDYRIKMCTQIDLSHLETIHHEMGHICYFMEYRTQPIIHRRGGNSAFHEAVGDTMAMSVTTTNHLRAIGLVEETEKNSLKSDDEESEYTNELINKIRSQLKRQKRESEDEAYKTQINFLMRNALVKIAFLPFALSIEFWRYEVLKGNINSSNYNAKWWEIRRKYQGIIPPVQRASDGFDPGSKYHISVFVPYARYFFSFIGQYQFYEALCKESGHQGPIQDCDFYKSQKAGKKLRSVLKEGGSKPWPTLLKKLTGESRFSAKAMLKYFEPLHKWLIRENEGRKVGW